MPGSVVVDVELHPVVRGAHAHHHPRGRELQRVLHQVGDDLRQALRVERWPAREHPARPRARRRCRPPPARTPRPRPAPPHAHVDRRGVQRELVRVEPREIEEVGDEPLEPARLRRDHVGGPDARVHSLDGAVGDRLRVAADRRQRRAQVVRHAEQERALVAPRHVEVIRHRVDRVREAGELVVAHVRRVDARGEVAAGDRPRGRLHRRQRAGHPAGEVGGDERGDPQRDGAAAPSTASPLPPNGRLFTSSASTTTGVVPLTAGEGAGDEHGVAVATLLRVAREQGLGVEVVDGDARRERGRVAGAAEQSCPPPPRPRRSASMATIAPFDARSVVFTRSRRRRSWRRPATVPTDARAEGSCSMSESNSGPTTSARSLHVVARVRDLGATGEACGHRRGEEEHTERDRHHGDDEAGAQPPAAGGSRRPSPAGASPGRRRPRRLEPVPDAAHGRDHDAVAELLAHLGDVHVDGAGVAEPVVAPHAVEDLLARRARARAARRGSAGGRTPWW